MVVSDIVLGGLTKSMEGLTSTLKSAMDFAGKAEKASLALGKTFGETNTELGGTMKGLRGDLSNRFAAAIAGMEAGLQGNTAGIARLVNQQRLTGTASGKTAKVFAQMEMTLGASRDATNSLAAGLPELGEKWMVSTDLLVGAIDTLSKSFPAQKLAGMGAEVTQAFTNLTAELGPAMSGPMENVMRAVMDTSQEGYENLTKLGITGVREQLSAAKSSAEATIILKNAIMTAGKTTKDFAGGSDKFFRMVGVTTETFGQASLDMAVVMDAFGERTAKEGEQAAAFGNQLSVLKSEVLVPLQTAFLEFQPIILAVAKVISETLQSVIINLVERAKALYVDFGGLTGIIAVVKQKFHDIKEALIANIGLIKTGLKIAIVVLAAKLVLFGISLIPVIAGFLALAVNIALFLLPVIAIAAPLILIGILVAKLNDKFKIWDKIVWALSKVFTVLKVALSILLIPLKLLILPFKLLGSFISSLNDKFKIWDTVVGFLSDAFNMFKEVIFGILKFFDDMPFIGGFLDDFGDSLKESSKAVDVTTKTITRLATRQEAIQIAQEGRDRTIARMEREGNKDDPRMDLIHMYQNTLEMQNRNLEELRNTTDEQYKLDKEAQKTQEKTQEKAMGADAKKSEEANRQLKNLGETQDKAIGADAKKAQEAKLTFEEQLAIDKKTFGVGEDSARNLAEINAKTPEITTTPEFLDETANMLGRSIEGILGVGRDTTSEEMLEELRTANEQRAKAAAEAPTGGGHIQTNPN